MYIHSNLEPLADALTLAISHVIRDRPANALAAIASELKSMVSGSAGQGLAKMITSTTNDNYFQFIMSLRRGVTGQFYDPCVVSGYLQDVKDVTLRQCLVASPQFPDPANICVISAVSHKRIPLDTPMLKLLLDDEPPAFLICHLAGAGDDDGPYTRLRDERQSLETMPHNSRDQESDEDEDEDDDEEDEDEGEDSIDADDDDDVDDDGKDDDDNDDDGHAAAEIAIEPVDDIVAPVERVADLLKCSPQRAHQLLAAADGDINGAIALGLVDDDDDDDDDDDGYDRLMLEPLLASQFQKTATTGGGSSNMPIYHNPTLGATSSKQTSVGSSDGKQREQIDLITPDPSPAKHANGKGPTLSSSGDTELRAFDDVDYEGAFVPNDDEEDMRPKDDDLRAPKKQEQNHKQRIKASKLKVGELAKAQISPDGTTYPPTMEQAKAIDFIVDQTSFEDLEKVKVTIAAFSEANNRHYSVSGTKFKRDDGTIYTVKRAPSNAQVGALTPANVYFKKQSPEDVSVVAATAFSLKGRTFIQVCETPDCDGHIGFRYMYNRKANEGESAGKFVCKKFVDCSESCEARPDVRRMSTFSYSPSQLAPVVAREMANDPKVKPAKLKSVLQAHLRSQPPEAYVRKVMAEALGNGKKATGMRPNQLGGMSFTDSFRLVSHFAEALAEKGHHVVTQKMNGNKMKEALLKKAKVDHKAQQEALPASSQKTPFAITPELQARVDAVKADDDYYAGVIIIFAWASKFLETQTSKRILGADAGHAHHPDLGGVVICVDAVDANRSTVPISRAHFWGNERAEVWRMMCWTLNEYLGDVLNDAIVTFYRDGKKEIQEAFDRYLDDARQFLCARHGGEAAAIAVPGPHILERYQEMANVTSMNRLSYLKSQAPAALLNYLQTSNTSEDRRFLAEFAKAGGKTQATVNRKQQRSQYVTARCTDQFAEANQHTSNLDLLRHALPVQFMELAVESAVDRMTEHARKANGNGTAQSPPYAKTVPPQVANILQVHKDIATTRLSDRDAQVRLVVGSRTQATVKPSISISGGTRFNCNIGTVPPTCECGFTATTDFPCLEMHLLCQTVNKPVESLLAPCDLTLQWQREMSCFDWGSAKVTTSAIDHGLSFDTTLLPPITIPRPAGAPKKKRHRSWRETAARKAQKPTGGGSKAGYKCGKCGQIKKGHTCTATG